jgi:glycerol dehydrogenase
MTAASCAQGETNYNELIPVTPDMLFSALKAADADGRRRQASK